jgi:membrane-associated phospholipid phosphatase
VRRGTQRIAAVGAALCFLVDASSAAQTLDRIHELRWNPPLDLTVTVSGAAAWIASEALQVSLAPSTCRWCEVDSVDARVRDALIWHDTALSDTLSNVTGFLLVPLTGVGLDALAAAHDGSLHHVPEDALLIAEAGVIAGDLTQLVKMAVGRKRPFVHALGPDQKPMTNRLSDNNLSFFSGHTTETFALASAAGTISTMRGYRWAPLVWPIGGVMALATGYLRIAADKHWLTDVLVGAVVGAGIGFAVPYFFHSAVDEPPRPSAPMVGHASAPSLAGALMTIGW